MQQILPNKFSAEERDFPTENDGGIVYFQPLMFAESCLHIDAVMPKETGITTNR